MSFFTKNWKIWVVIFVIIVLLYLGNKFIDNFKGSAGTKEIDKALSVADKNNQEQYYNDNDLKGFAFSINEMLNHGGNDLAGFFGNMFQDDNEDGVVSILKQMQKTGDILKVSQYYTKNFERNLQSDMRSELSSEQIDEVNSYFDSKGIVYNF